jgi:hypothetical protein
LSVLAVIALIALFFGRRIPARHPSASPEPELEPEAVGLRGSAS